MTIFLNLKSLTHGVVSLAAIVSLVLLSAASAGAQVDSRAGAQAEEEKVENVNTGLIAGSGSFATSGSLDVQTSGSAPGDEASVITGGVTFGKGGTCEVSISNSSEKNAYAVNYRVVGTPQIGASSKTLKSLSARLSPGETVSRKVNCAGYTAVGLDLRSSKKIERN